MTTIVGPIKASPGLPGGTSAANNLTAPQVIKGTPGICVRISCITGGSLTLNDAATLGAAGATNEFFSSTTLTDGQVEELNWPCAAGIVASAASGVFSISFS